MNLKPPLDAHGAEGADAAAYWVARRRLNLMTSQDEAAFAAWRAEPANARAYDEADDVVEDIGAIAAVEDVRRMREAALAAAPLKRRARPWRMLSAVAALVAVAVATPLLMRTMPAPVEAPAIAQTRSSEVPAPLVAPKRYATKVGERLSVTLEDGSVVALNTASVLEVAFTPERRNVRLIQGQALFQVAKNKTRPFVVVAGDRRVTAVGTEFDVRVDGSRVKVALVEGKVLVDPLHHAGLGRLAPILARQELEPGEQLIAMQDSPVVVSAVDVERTISWRNGQVIFRDDTIQSAVAEMNRYSATQIVIEDERISDLRVSGVFGVARVENFLAALTSYYPIATERRSPLVTALVWRAESAQEKISPNP